MSDLSSRERLITALARRKPDHVPCCFMIFQSLQRQCASDFEFFDRQLALGVDVRVELPDLPFHFTPDVGVRAWKEQRKEEAVLLLHKEYRTPAGTLTTMVRQTQDWIHGEDVPLFDDYLAPRAVKFLVTERADVAALRHLLAPPREEEIAAFRAAAAAYRRYARAKGLLLSGGYRDWRSNALNVVGNQGGAMVGTDALMWLCGATAPLFWAFDQPDLLEELIALIAARDQRHMELMLDAGAELIVERAWYAGTEFWSPKLYRQFIAPMLRAKIQIAHQAGAKFGYIITSGVMPILDDLLDLQIDAILGVDPVQGKGTDLSALARRVKGRMCIWGGVSAPMSVEHATRAEIWRAVENAISTCGAQGGFILSPVDNIIDPSRETWKNVSEFIDAWRQMWNI
jgi:hypothetical protein